MHRLGFARLIDRYFGSSLCLLFGLFSKKISDKILREKAEKAARILIIRVWTIGESLLSLPMIKRLYEEFPTAKIDILVTGRSRPVFLNHCFINDLIDLSVKNFFRLLRSFRQYDLVIDAEPYFRFSALSAGFFGRYRIGFDHGIRRRMYCSHGHYLFDDHVVYSFCSLLKPLGVDFRAKELVSLPFSDSVRKSIERKLQEIGRGGAIIGLHTSSSEGVQDRAWATEHFGALIELCRKHKPPFTIILTGYSQGDKARNQLILKKLNSPEGIFDWAGKLTFEEFCAFLSRIDCFVANDGGPMHVAAAQGAKTIGLFGPETPARYGPFPPEKHLAFYKNPEFGIGPCVRPWLGKHLDCRRQIEALNSIDPEEVFAALKEMSRK